jgi:filamentous hemagglutinin family protein
MPYKLKNSYALQHVVLLFGFIASFQIAHAQIATSITSTPGAGSLGTAVTQAGKVYNITGGTRAGTNLFHSFGNFSVGAGDTANFLNTPANGSLPLTSNILGRVTGGNISNIFGTIRTTGFGNANLFLMNPAGFLFGPNATVNVGGMVAFTSADYLRLEDGKVFNAALNPNAGAILSSAPVAAYGFLGSNPGAITVQGTQLSVTPGHSLSLVGGNITVQSGVVDDGITVQPASLTAPGGQINLASVASPGEILQASLQTAPNLNGQAFTGMGNIRLSEGATLDVSADSAGTVHIRGGQLVMAEGTISADTVNTPAASTAIDVQLSGDLFIANDLAPALTARTTGSSNAGSVNIVSENINATSNTLDILSLIDTHTSGQGTAGSVNITTGDFQMTGSLQGFSGFIDTGTKGPGHGGNVNITARNMLLDTSLIATGNFWANAFGEDVSGAAGNVTITADSLHIVFGGIDANSFSFSQFTGRGGNITLHIGDIQMQNSLIQSQAIERGGAIIVTADHILLSDSRFETQTVSGTGGGITIGTKTIDLTGGSQLISTTGGDGNAGSIHVDASDHVGILEGSKFVRPSGIFTQTFGTSGATGNAGDIVITTPELAMRDGGRINSVTKSSGSGGNVSINADSVTMSGEFPDEITEPLFNLGPIHQSGIFTSTAEGNCVAVCGKAGNISITTGSLTMGSGSQIDSGTSSTGQGGNITINASGPITLSGTLSDGSPVGVFSRSSGTDGGSGYGGNIELHAGSFQVTNGAQISANSSGTGNAGNVILQGPASPAQSVLIDGTRSGIFTDTHDTGAGGNISVDSNSVTLQNGGTISAATSGTSSSATGGTITLNAEQVTVNTQAVITADTNGIAPAGTIDINTGSLAINSGGQIRSSSGAETEQVSALAFSLTAAPTLTGGTITIQGRTGIGSQADTVTIDGPSSGVFTESTGARPGGDINIFASQSVALTNGATISASSTGFGNAGKIQINAGSQLAMNGSSVTTEANQASGGAIKITTTPGGTVELTDSTITASVLDGTGGGGSVDIDPQFVILQNSQILANSVFGPGGNISITTNLLLPDTTSVISASSQFGQQGNIVIQSPVSPASGKIIPLGQKPLIATALVSQRCAALAGGNASSFTVAGRDSLPAEPGGLVPSPLALSMAEANEGPATETALSRFSEMEEETPLLSLRKVAPAGFLTQSFGAASSDCQS